MPSRNYRDLLVWQRAVDLVEISYSVTRRFPKEETFGLTQQIRRSAVSVPSNIAEGQGRGSDMEFCRFLRIAHGSLRELETQFLISERLKYLSAVQLEDVLQLAETVGRLLTGLIRSKRLSN